MRKTFWCAALLGTGLVAGAMALHAVPPHGSGHVPPFAHGHGHMPPDDCPFGGNGPCGALGGMTMMHQALEALDLSDAQREAVHETFIARRADIAAALKPVIEAKRTLHNAVLADNPNDAAIRNAATALGASVGDAAVTFADIRVEMFENAQLTPAQVQKFAEFRVRADAAIDTLLNEHIPAMLEDHASGG
jgi:Spy/CpxP family protein refolding chaperone